MTEPLLTAAVVAAVISVLGVVFSTLVPIRADAAARRRDRYAEAVGSLVEWFELPYRVARRSDNEVQTRKDLVNRIHDLQVAIVRHQAWIAGESTTTYRAFARAAEWVRQHCRAPLQEAWHEQPNPDRMNIGDLGLDRAALEERVRDIEALIGLRFGWGRFRLLRRFHAWRRFS